MALLRRALIAASDSERLRRVVTGTRPGRAVAMQFVAGETLDDAMRVVTELAATGRDATLDVLGEAVRDADVARHAADTYVEALRRIGETDLDCGVSIKPTALGLDIDHALWREQAERVAEAADAVGQHVTIDMEGSDVTQVTIDDTRDLHEAGHDLGCAVQAYLHRTEADVIDLAGRGCSLRLTKGAYAEPESIAWQGKEEIRDAYVRLAEIVLAGSSYGRFATHDHVIIERIIELAARYGVGDERFEFQMLYGVRDDLQRQLVQRGHRVRVYVPVGEAWYPYFTRRLAERPANLLFFLRALAGLRRRR